MPITKSAKKALRQTKRRRVFNLRRLRQMKLSVKNVQKLIQEGNKEGAAKSLSTAYKAIDKAAKKGVIKKNTASRKKSRLTKAINRVNPEQKS